MHDYAPALEVHDLTVSYDKKPVLYGIDLCAKAGELVGIMGPNGAGKSTFMKTVMGLIQPTEGWVRIFGEPVYKQLKRVAYVPQRESIDWDFPVSVFDVALMGRYGKLGLLRRPKSTDKDFAAHCLERVGLLEFAKRQISELSGGQQQRVFLARALAQESELYFMDEPFAGIDVTTERLLIELFQELKAKGKSLFIVHHDIGSAKHYFDSLILLNMRLIAFGPTQSVLTEQVLNETYGGRLNILSQMAHILQQTES